MEINEKEFINLFEDTFYIWLVDKRIIPFAHIIILPS